MNKTAAELPLNTIITAIIALVVLVVLIFIFSSSARDFVFGLKDCNSLGGVCQDKITITEPCGPNAIQLVQAVCNDDKGKKTNEICCKSATG